VVVDGDEGEGRVFELSDVVDQACGLKALDCTSRLQIYGEDCGEQEQGQADGWIHLEQTILDSLGQSEFFVAFVEEQFSQLLLVCGVVEDYTIYLFVEQFVETYAVPLSPFLRI